MEVAHVLGCDSRLAAYLLSQGNQCVGEHVKAGARPHTVKMLLLMAGALSALGYPARAARYDDAVFGARLEAHSTNAAADLSDVFRGAVRMCEAHDREGNLTPFAVRVVAFLGGVVASHASQESSAQMRNFLAKYAKPVYDAARACASPKNPKYALPAPALSAQEWQDWMAGALGGLHGALGGFWHTSAESHEIRDATEGYATPVMH